MEARSGIATQRVAPAARDLSLVIEDRRATQHFTDQQVKLEDLAKILHYAGQAPSGYNLQPWRFLVVQEPDNKKRLQKVAFNQPKVAEASAVIVFLGMKEQTKAWAHEILEDGVRHGLGKSENIPGIIEGSMAFISHLGWDVWVNRHVMISFGFAMLMAESLGYDTAPMEGFDPEGVKREFGIPNEADVIALLAIGRAKMPDKKYPGRLPLERVAFSEKFGEPFKASHEIEPRH